jgi:hypothetical protein
MRILRRTPPVGTARRSVSFSASAFTLLHFPRPAHGTPRIQGTLSRADGRRRCALSFVAVCWLPPCLCRPRVCVNGNRETQRECFQALRVQGWQSQALCRPFKNIHGEFPHPHQPCTPTTPGDWRSGMLEYWNIAQLPTATSNCYSLLPIIPPFRPVRRSLGKGGYSIIPVFFASGMFLPPAHKAAALSPYAGPLPGRRTLCNCPNPNLAASLAPVFFLFRETLWFVCLTLASSPSPHKPPRGTAADAALR